MSNLNFIELPGEPRLNIVPVKLEEKMYSLRIVKLKDGFYRVERLDKQEGFWRSVDNTRYSSLDSAEMCFRTALQEEEIKVISLLRRQNEVEKVVATGGVLRSFEDGKSFKTVKEYYS